MRNEIPIEQGGTMHLFSLFRLTLISFMFALLFAATTVWAGLRSAKIPA